jgi:PPM family protein phosphatase
MTPTHPLDYSAATHPGLKRENNEDCFVSAPDAGLWGVADGMGGHEAGEVASAIVRDTLERLARDKLPFSLGDAIQQSHQAILRSAEQGIGAPGMGSTLVTLLSNKRQYEIAWVGDSRAYLWTATSEGGQLTRLTTDHSYVQMLYAAGAISAEEVEHHPDKNIITQCLGMQELAQVKVDITHGQWQQNQWILLCSDGLTDELSDSDIAQILQHSSNSLTAVDQLLHAALTNGGNDNITLQIIESPLGSSPPMNSGLWKWIPQISTNRLLDAALFGTALATLLGLLITTLR